MRKNKLTIITAIFLSVLLIRCVDIPNDLVLPVWDVNIEMPIINRTYLLEEAIEDENLINAYNDPDRFGLLFYSDTIDIEAISIENNLTFDGFTESVSQKIGSIRINDVDPVTTNISIADWTPVSPGTQVIIPEVENAAQNDFTLITSFESAVIESGNLTISITNNSPVTTEFRGINIVNSSDQSIFLELPASSPISIDPFGNEDVNFDLTNKVISSQLQLKSTLYTPGSNGNQVELPGDAGAIIIGTFTELVIKEVRAVLPQQAPFGIDDAIEISDSNFVEEVVFKSGSFDIVIDNFLDLDLEIDLHLENFEEPSGNTYRTIIPLMKNDRNKVVNIPDLNGWKIVSNVPGELSNQVFYSAQVTTRESDHVATLNKDDSISIRIDFKESVLKNVSGRIAPINFALDTKTFELDVGNLEENFSFDEVFIDDPDLRLNLTSVSNVEFKLDGELTATNGTQTNSLMLNNVLINPSSTTSISLKDYGLKELINSFSKELPENFALTGNVKINPNYKIVSVAADDSVTIDSELEIPLKFGIAGGSFVDTLELEVDDSSESVENVNFAALTMEIENYVPVALNAKGTLLDNNGNVLIPIPPDYNELKEIVVEAPTVDSDGNVVEPGKVTQKIEMQGEDVQKFLGDPQLILTLSMLTPPAGSTLPVKFNITDSVKVKVFGTLDYRVDH